jgi:hypothetical protein
MGVWSPSMVKESVGPDQKNLHTGLADSGYPIALGLTT